MAVATKDFLYRIGTKGAKRAEKDLKGVDKATKAMVGSAAKLVVGFISLAAAIKTFQFAFSAAKLAAQAQNVERAFGNLAKQAGTTADIMIKKMREATAETISDFQLMQQFNTAAMLGLPLDQFDKMIEIARGAAQAMGQSMQFMLQSVVTGIGRQSKLMLDNLGILISAESANRRYAAALGIQASALTDVQRKQAFANEAVRIGLENLEAAGGVVESNADAYQKAVAGLENFRIEFGKMINPTTVRLINNFVSVYTALMRVFGFVPSLGPIEEAATKVVQLQAAIESIRGGTLEWLKIVKDLGIELEINAPLIDNLIILYDAEAAALTRLGDIRREVLSELIGGMEEVTLRTEEYRAELIATNEEGAVLFDKLLPSQQLLINGVEQLTDGLIQATLYGQKFGDSIVASLKSIAAQLIKQAAVYLLMNLFTGGTASFGGFVNFAGTGNFPMPPLPTPSVQQPAGGTIVIFPNAVLIGTNEMAIRDQLLPLIDQARADA